MCVCVGGKEKKGRYKGWEAFVGAISTWLHGCYAGFGLLVITPQAYLFAGCTCVCILYWIVYRRDSLHIREGSLYIVLVMFS